jgi:hypothetical protein
MTKVGQQTSWARQLSIALDRRNRSRRKGAAAKTTFTKFILAIVLATCGLFSPSPALATSLSVVLDVQGPGLCVADAGVGLQGIGADSRSLTVVIGGSVQAALLYWAGRDGPCPQVDGHCVIPAQPYRDQVLRFDGNQITGTIIGTEEQPVSAVGPISNIGYLADVTSIVQAKGTGLQSFTVADGDTSNNLFRLLGAGLLVIYADPFDTAVYRIVVYDGLDFAYGADPTPGAARVTAPVTFSHGSTPGDRQATLRLFVGDCDDVRPDRVDVSNNPSIVDALCGADGPAWDTLASVVDIPGGVAATTVQVVSEPVDQNPDNLLWQLAVLRVPLSAEPPAPDMGCGPGYWKGHAEAWPPTGYSPSQTVGSVFGAAGAYPSLASQSLLQEIHGRGGPGTSGGAQILLRAAVASLLNAAHPDVNYPRTEADVLASVNVALASNNRAVMLELATELAVDNDEACPLD